MIPEIETLLDYKFPAKPVPGI